MAVGLTPLSVVIVLYAATALRLGRWSISMPMVFVAIGYWIGPGGANLFTLSLQRREREVAHRDHPGARLVSVKSAPGKKEA